MKKFLFSLLFIAGEMKCNFALGVFGVKRPIEKCKQTRARYRDKHVGGKIHVFIEKFYVKSTQELIKILNF